MPCDIKHYYLVNDDTKTEFDQNIKDIENIYADSGLYFNKPVRKLKLIDNPCPRKTGIILHDSVFELSIAHSNGPPFTIQHNAIDAILCYIRQTTNFKNIVTLSQNEDIPLEDAAIKLNFKPCDLPDNAWPKSLHK